jgi:hypothetical protein
MGAVRVRLDALEANTRDIFEHASVGLRRLRASIEIPSEQLERSETLISIYLRECLVTQQTSSFTFEPRVLSFRAEQNATSTTSMKDLGTSCTENDSICKPRRLCSGCAKALGTIRDQLQTMFRSHGSEWREVTSRAQPVHCDNSCGFLPYSHGCSIR